MPRPPLFTRPFVMAAMANLVLCSAGFLLIHFPGHLRELGAGEALIGRVLAVGPLVGIMLAPLAGRVMDRRGRRVVILTGSVVSTCALGLYMTIESIGPWVYFVHGLNGAGGTLLYTSLFTYGADQVPSQRRTEGLAIFGVSGLLPMAVSGLLGDWILAVGSYRDLYATATGLSVLGMLMALGLRDAPATQDALEPPRPWRMVVLQPDLLPVWLVSAAFFVALAIPFSFLKTFVMERGIGSVGTFFTSYALIAVALRLFFGWLPDRIGPKRLLAPSVGCYAAGLLMLATATTGNGVLVAGLLCGIGHGYVFPILFSMVVTRARDSERGAAMSIYATIDGVSHLTAVPLFGLLIEGSGYPLAFSSAAAVLVVGTALFYLWDRGADRDQRPSTSSSLS